MASEPTRFLSTVQVGITCLGILSGAIGEATIARRLREVFEQVPALHSMAGPLAVGVMVVLVSPLQQLAAPARNEDSWALPLNSA